MNAPEAAPRRRPISPLQGGAPAARYRKLVSRHLQQATSPGGRRWKRRCARPWSFTAPSPLAVVH